MIIFLTLFGLGIGLAIGVILMRRVDRAAAKATPGNVADQVLKAGTRIANRVRVAAGEAGRAAADREAELREQFDVPTTAAALGLERHQ